MTGLLVSVRQAREAEVALAGGADLIDIKEPSRGALGRADFGMWREVAAVVQGQAPLSVALGELAEFDPRNDAPAAWPAVRYAKLGLARCAALPDWRRRWAHALDGLPPTVRSVAVSYADWRSAQAPPPAEVIDAGQRLGCAAWLLDTFNKTHGDLCSHVSLAEVSRWLDRARRHGMMVVLAGSLTLEVAETLLPLRPDFLGVRGAACRHGRDGPLDPDRVRQWAALVKRVEERGGNPCSASTGVPA